MTKSDYKAYAGIGSRSVDRDTGKLMQDISRRLCDLGWTLRSGGASGSDTYFEKGVYDNKKEIFLPWENFNGNSSNRYHLTIGAYDVARSFHPAYHKLTYAAKK